MTEKNPKISETKLEKDEYAEKPEEIEQDKGEQKDSEPKFRSHSSNKSLPNEGSFLTSSSSQEESRTKEILNEGSKTKFLASSVEDTERKEIKELKEISEVISKKETSYGNRNQRENKFTIESWEPKTNLGRRVKDGKIKNLDEILDKNEKILESEIVDSLLNLKTDLILIGQSKGKFGGGKRRAWKQTQRKTEEGNVLKFSAMSVVGDENGHIGIGKGNSVETLPARDKSSINAKLNIFKITRKCSAFDCECSEQHTIPFKVSGKSGSVEIKLIPAPQGTGLVVTNELKKVLRLAGIKDIYSKTTGQTRTTENLVKACIDALKKTNMRQNKIKISGETK